MTKKSTLERYVDLVLEHWNLGRGPCKTCPYNSAKSNPDFAFGDTSEIGMMVVAQNPGGESTLGRKRGSGRVTSKDYFGKAVKEARKEGWPWIGVLEDMVRGTHFEGPSGVYWTNLCKCHSFHRGTGRISNASKHCELYLPAEIAFASPRIMVAFGRLAAQALIRSLELPIKFARMSEIHGHVATSRTHGTRVLFFSHWGRRDGESYRKEIQERFSRAVKDTGF